MNRQLFKSAYRSVGRSFGRFAAIVVIVAVGIAFFSGMSASGPDMSATLEKYYNDTNYYDLCVRSTIGLSTTDVAAVAEVSGVRYVMPVKFIDGMVKVDGNVESDLDGSQISARAYGIDLDYVKDYASGIYDGSFISKPELIRGSWPKTDGECLVDGSALSTPESYKIGSVISLTGDGSNLSSKLTTTEFKIVGVIRSPNYVSFERGNTDIGSGKVGSFIYIPASAFKTDYYTELYVKSDGASENSTFSKKYLDNVDQTRRNIEAIAPDRLTVRAAELNITLSANISAATLELNSKKDALATQFRTQEEQLEQLRQLRDNGDAIYAQKQAEYLATYSQAQQALTDSNADYTQKLAAYSQLVALVNEGQAAYDAAKNEYDSKKAVYDEYSATMTSWYNNLQTAKATLNTTSDLLKQTKDVLGALEQLQMGSANQEQVQNVISVLQNTYPELYKSIYTLTAQGTAAAAIQLVKPIITQYENRIASEQAKVDEYQAQYDQAKAYSDQAYSMLLENGTLLTSKYTALQNAKAQLDTAEIQLQQYANTLTDGKTTLQLGQIKAQQELYTLKSEVENAKLNYDSYAAQLAEAESEANEQIDAVQADIDEAKATLGKIATANWMISDRTQSQGFANFDTTVTNLRRMSHIFPVFFIVVAALVALTSMTRMVTSERIEIGTLKAIGYQNREIKKKYIVYAVIAAAVGCAAGLAGGLYLFPLAIYKTYSIMYDIPDLTYTLPIPTIIISAIVALLCTVLAAYVACTRELTVDASTLMLPKAPLPGKRVLLEKVGFIWKRLSFTSKVTVRNTFRYAARAVSTVIGIAGCTALLLAGLGTYDSVNAVMDSQFGANGISNYDFTLAFTHPQIPGQSATLDYIADDARVTGCMLVSMKSLSGGGSERSDPMDVYVFVPSDPAAMNEYIHLRSSKDGSDVEIDDFGGVITAKFAKDTGTSVGDTVWVRDTDNNTYTIPVTAIVENYTFHYIYLNATVYTNIFGAPPSYDYALGTLSSAVKDEVVTKDNIDSSNKALLTADILDRSDIAALSYMTDTQADFKTIINALSSILYIFIGAAALLAFVVLYNLSNINIQERRREIGTIKVLGFRDGEVSSYIYRENMLLTLIGSVIGIPLGLFGHWAVLQNIEIEAVTFGNRINPLSYVLAIVITWVFAGIVNLVMYRKLMKIDMVESMRSYE